MSPFLFQKKLKPAWLYSTRSILWRILPTEAGIIVGEERNPDLRTTTFFALDESSGQRLWSERSLPEGWWVGIEAVHGQVLLLHGYPKPDLPEHNKIIAVSLETGELLWRNDDLTYWFATAERIIAFKQLFDQRIGYALKPESGNIVETFENIEELLELRSNTEFRTPETVNQFPNLLSRERLNESSYQLIERAMKNDKPAGQVEYLQSADTLAFAYHTGGAVSSESLPKLTHRMKVIDTRSRRLVYEDILSREATYPVLDSFFVRGKRLYYVKDQRTLVALSL